MGLAILLLTAFKVGAYAVLAHQAEIDVVWESHLKPLLHKKYPGASEEELDGAEAYAYGGAIIQDLRYYPYASRFFSDLARYVRGGGFVSALLRAAQNVDEYAFALGALSHYASDTDGHRIATNPSVPILYPKLQEKYGNQVTYEDDPLASQRPANASWHSCTSSRPKSGSCGFCSCGCRHRKPRSCLKLASTHRSTGTGPCLWKRIRTSAVAQCEL